MMAELKSILMKVKEKRLQVGLILLGKSLDVGAGLGELRHGLNDFL